METNRVIALGFFDGVHIGHGALLRLTRERATALGCTASALTFDAHPDTVIFGTPMGGGAFFGKVGSFLPGYEFDAVVLDDASLDHPQELGIRARLERAAYLADERNVAEKYVSGRRVL